MIYIIMFNLKKYGGPPEKYPEKLVFVAKIASVICVIMGLTMAADLALPKNVVTAKVSKYTGTKIVNFGIYSEDMNSTAYKALRNNETVKLEVSKIYDEIKRITLTEDNNKVLNFPTVDDYMFILMTIVYLIPLMVIIKKKYTSTAGRYIHFGVTMLSPILGIVAAFLLIKLFLVHGIHVFPRM